METEVNMLELIRQLHFERVVAGQAKAELDAIRTTTDEAFALANRDLIADVKGRQETVNLLDQRVRELAVSTYSADPSIGKAPYPGIGIRETTGYDYDNKEALRWATQRGMCLKLDAPAFNDVCKSDANRPGFVLVTKTLTATIASDLAPVLGGAYCNGNRS